MNNHYNSKFLATFRCFSKYVSLIVIGVGLLELIGWTFDLPILRDPGHGLESMQANSAVAFILTGIALWLAGRERANSAVVMVRHICAALAALLGLLTLGQYIFQWNLGIDQIIARGLQDPAGAFPDRMSFASGINFSLLGFALLLLDRRVDRLYPAPQPLALIVGSIAGIAVLGHVFEDESLNMVGFFSSQALSSALNFVLLALGLVCARPERGFVGILASKTYGGRALRRLLPFTIGIPVLIAWLGLLGRNAGFYDARFGVILLAATMSVLLTLTAWLTSAWLHRLDSERGQADEKLRQSEEKFQNAFQYSAIGMALVTPDGRWLRVNESLCKLTGYTEDELLTKTFQEITHPDDLNTGIAYLQQMLDGEPFTCQIEKRYIHKAGHVITVLLSVSLLRDRQNQPLFFTAQIEDITERKRAEDALRQSEERFQNAFEYAAIGMALVALDGHWLRVNEALCNLTGYTRNEMLTKTFQEITHPDDLPADLQQAQRLLTGEIQTYQMEKRYFHKAGHIIWILLSVSLMRDRENQPLFFIAQIEDITERKQAEEQVAYQARLLDNVHDTVIATDAQFNLTFWNRAAEETYGYKADEVLGRQLNEVIHSEITDDQRTAALKALQETGSYNIEVIQHHRNGQRFWVEVSAFTVQDSSGQTYGSVSVNRDITERKQAEEKLRQSERRFRALIENGSDQISILAADGSLMYENPSANPILGYPFGEFTGQNLFHLVHPDDLDRLQSILNHLIQDATFSPREQFRLRASDGTWRWVEAVGRNLLDEPSVQGIVVNYHDITERRQAQNRIETQLRRLEALHAIDGAITGSMDLRVTLNVVLAQVATQLGMDAASVLLFNPYTRTLSHAAGRGFRTRAIEQSHVRLGEGLAGTALLKRHTIHQHAPFRSPDFTRSALLEDEGFVEYHAAPLIAKGNMVGILEVFHRTPLAVDEQWKLFLETVASQTAIAIDNAHLFESLQRSNMDLVLAYDTTIEGWSRALDLRDKETEGHTQRVTALTLELARTMSIPNADLIHIRRGALLHDIGKMGVPDHILLKPDKLTEQEWDLMRQHPIFAKDLLSQIEFLHPALDIPHCHHEKWDGTGYPRGLKGEQIPLAARIFAIVDVYDALISDRPYRAGWTKEKTLEHIRSESGTHFDPRVVEAFLAMMRKRGNGEKAMGNWESGVDQSRSPVNGHDNRMLIG